MSLQVGEEALFGVTFDTSGLDVGIRIFDSSGAPVTSWMAMLNYDGNSYSLPYTFTAAGSYGIKKVVFTDSGLTTRDGAYFEADETVQVSTGGGSGGVTVESALAGFIIPEGIVVGSLNDEETLCGVLVDCN